MTNLQNLLDRAQIEDALHRYAQAQDQNAWHLYGQVFTPDAEIELVGLPVGTLSVSDFEEFLRNFNSTRLSGQHLIANTLTEIAVDTARSVSEVVHFTLQHTDEPGRLKLSEGNSLYVDTWRRTPTGWRIAHRVVTQKHLDERLVDYDPTFIDVVRTGAGTDWFDVDLETAG